MTWTAPMTAVANTAFTSAQYNLYVRDNMLETAPAKATTVGGYFVVTGTNAITQRTLASNTIATFQGTTSTTYTNLATLGPAVTVTTGTQAKVHISAKLANTVAANFSYASAEVSGATTVAASDARAIQSSLSTNVRYGVTTLFTGLSPGSNTFTIKYRAGANTANFQDREIVVEPL